MWKCKCALLAALILTPVASAQPWRNPTAWSEQRRREDEERNRILLMARSAAHSAQHLNFRAPKLHTPAPSATRSWGGGLAAIGGAIAALFGAIFGRKK